ncbi:MAG: preprotein translocase subunit SecE [Candidatus Gastranaerophilaceae bacterium]
MNSSEDKTNQKFSQDAVVKYFKGVKTEWGKITWPSKPQVIAETVYVIVITTVFTLMIYLLDLLFQWMLHFLPGVAHM